MSVRGFTTQAERDRADYAAWIAGQLERIHNYGGAGFDVWDRSKLRRAGLSESREDAEAFRGPWRTVRPYATQEFLWWVEAQGEPRYTFSEWQARARAERDAEAHKVREWLDSAGYCLSELEVLRDMLARRDELIATARERGAAWADITAASGLSRMQAHTVAKAHAARVQSPQQVAPAEPGPEWRVLDGELVEVF